MNSFHVMLNFVHLYGRYACEHQHEDLIFCHDNSVLRHFITNSFIHKYLNFTANYLNYLLTLQRQLSLLLCLKSKRATNDDLNPVLNLLIPTWLKTLF